MVSLDRWVNPNYLRYKLLPLMGAYHLTFKLLVLQLTNDRYWFYKTTAGVGIVSFFGESQENVRNLDKVLLSDPSTDGNRAERELIAARALH
jgi:hypothetical protein